MHTIEEMQKLEQEHKDRIANMTAQYVAEQAKTTAAFDKQCVEAAAVLRGLEDQRVDLARAIEKLNQDRVLAQGSVDTARRELDDLASMQRDFIAGMERDADLKRQALKALQVEELKLTGEIIAAKDKIVALGQEYAESQKKYDAHVKLSQGVLDGLKAEAKTAAIEIAQLEQQVLGAKDALSDLRRETNSLTFIRDQRQKESAEFKDLLAVTELALTDRRKELAEQTAKLAENLNLFKDIEAAKADLATKALDVNFQKTQNERKARELADKENKLAALAAK